MEVAVVTLVGRLFHAWAAITRKHLSPMVRQWFPLTDRIMTMLHISMLP